MTTKSGNGRNPSHDRSKSSGMALLAAVLACCSWAGVAHAYEELGPPLNGLRSPTWSLGNVTSITYSEDLTHGTNDVAGNGEWNAVQGVMQSTSNLAYQVTVHSREYFPAFPGSPSSTMDTTDIYTIPLFKFQQVSPGTGAAVQWAGWDDSPLLTSAEVGITDPTRTIHFPDAKLHTLGLNWTTNVPEGQYSPNIDVGTVAIHELGHALGMGHPNPSHPESVMYQGYDGVAQRMWATDDLNGLADLYGPQPGVDYGSVVMSWGSFQDAENWINSILLVSGRETSGYAKLWPDVKEPALRSGYFTIPSSGVLSSWDISWSLPSYGPQDASNQDGALSSADLLMAKDLWSGQNTFAQNIVPLPEPTTLLLLAVGGLSLLRRRTK